MGNVMIACTLIFAISTTILFTLSNPGASGGPATQRPLSNQAGNIGLVMGITFSVPLVLSVVYPIYGSQCCQDTKDQQLPSEDGQEAPSQFNRYVVAIGIIHWGIFLFGVGFIVFSNLAALYESQNNDPTNPVKPFVPIVPKNVSVMM